MRTLKGLLSLISLCAIATPLYAQSTYGYIAVTDATSDGVAEQVNTPQGLVVIANLINNGVSMQVENRSWQRVPFSEAGLEVTCVAIPPTTGMYYAGDILGVAALETTQTVLKRLECRPNYKATSASVHLTAPLPTQARSTPLTPSNAHDNVAIADYTYDNIPVQVNEGNNTQLEAYVRNRTGEFRIRNSSNAPIRIEKITTTTLCGRTRPAGLAKWAQGDRTVTTTVESTPSNEKWVVQGQTYLLTNTCPLGFLAKTTTFVTSLD